MVYLRYLTCVVAAFAVISYTVHLERNTPVVLSVKRALGLDTTNLEAARRGDTSPSIVSAALAFFRSSDELPSLGDLLGTDSGRKFAQHVPDPVAGWMREDRLMSAQEVTDFEASFRRTGSNAADDARMVGAIYYRENMRMMITIARLDVTSAWNDTEMLALRRLFSESDGSSSKGVTVKGMYVPIDRDRRTGYGKISVATPEGALVQIRGNVPRMVMQEYLDSIPLLKPTDEATEAAALAE